MTIATILLAPPNGDPHGLLASGKAGARPPIAYQYNGAPWFYTHAEAMGWWLANRDTMEQPHNRALVLALDGEPVEFGVGRAALVFAKHEGAGNALFAAWRRGDQNERTRTGRWWLEWFEASPGDRGFAGGATYRRNWSYGDFGADRHVPLKRPDGIGDGWLLDAWALAATIANLLDARVVLLDSEGREVSDE